jgi:ComF family protein
LEASDSLVCDKCRQVLVPASQLQCRRCGADIGVALPDAIDCARCRREKYRFQRVICLGRYRDTLRDVILRMKRRTEEPLTVEMSRLLCNVRHDELNSLEADVVVPIPMHWTRRLVRGVNSAELLAAGVAKALNLPLAARALVRTRRTKKLAELSRAERKRALHDAFALKRGCDFRDARVLLIDDVLTTGTTCDTAAKALRREGAAGVFVAVIARAYPGD